MSSLNDKPSDQSSSHTRRRFVKQSAAGVAAAVVAPSVATAGKSGGNPITGQGDYQYEVIHHWPDLPSKYHWQISHNVAIDSEGLLYVIQEGAVGLVDHPSIFVFDQAGKFVRAFGEQFQGGGHGIEIRNEGGQDFVYVAAYLFKRSFAKLDTKGEVVWDKRAPMEAGGYADGEDVLPNTENTWGRDRFLPTNFAFHPDGDFYLADGYGTYRIHRYDSDGNWKSAFGAQGTDDGEFDTPHGLWIDDRDGEAKLVVCDRANGRLQWFTLDGEHLRTQGGFSLPANNDVRGDLLLVPDLFGRVTLLGKDNEVVAELGDDRERVAADKEFSIRKDESQWLPGKFVHPHDACFDAEGNIFVAEWVATGRVTKLRKLG
ncbi:MAG: twin-arginine translocation signal domain-containing protein [Planctomycetota bacterium]